MIPLAKHKKSMTLMALMTLATLLVLGSIYWIRPQGNPLFEGVRERKADTDLSIRSRVQGDQVLLVRDSSLVLDDCRLEYKGIRDEMVCIDLYLLELDPETPYHHFISESYAGQGFRMGNTRFTLVSSGQDQVWLRTAGRY